MHQVHRCWYMHPMNLFYLVESASYEYHIIAAVLSLTTWICHSRKWKYATSQVKYCWFLPWRMRSEIGKENDKMQSVRNIQSFILKTTFLSMHCCNKVIIGIDGCIMEMTAVIFFVLTVHFWEYLYDVIFYNDVISICIHSSLTLCELLWWICQWIMIVMHLLWMILILQWIDWLSHESKLKCESRSLRVKVQY